MKRSAIPDQKLRPGGKAEAAYTTFRTPCVVKSSKALNNDW